MAAELTPILVGDPPTGAVLSCAWGGDYLVVCQQYSAAFHLYRRDGATLTKLASPVAPNSPSLAAAWSPDGVYLAVNCYSSRYLHLYKRTGDTLTKLTIVATDSGSRGYGPAWDDTGTYLAVPKATSPGLALYKRAGDGLTRMADPSAISGAVGYACAWSGDYLAVVHDGYPHLTIYRRSGDTLAKLATPTPPAGPGKFCAWSGDYLAVANFWGDVLTWYLRTGDTLAKQVGPVGLPGGGYGCAWSGNHLTVGYSASPYLQWYLRDGSALVEQTAPTDLGSAAMTCAWSGDYLAVGQTAAPYLSLYAKPSSAREFTVTAELPPPAGPIALTHAPAITMSISGVLHGPVTNVSATIAAELPAPTAAVILAHVPHVIAIAAELPAPTVALALLHDWTSGLLPPAQTIYTLTLTGAPDVTLPISSLQTRLRNGEPSYLQVVVPNAPAYADQITARSAGQLVLKRGLQFVDGSRQMEEIARVALELIADARGANSQSITLSGHKTTTVAAPRTRELQGVSYRSAGTQKKRYRCRPDLFLRPGDTATVAAYGDSFAVGMITYTVSVSGGETMEITEA